MPHPNAVDEIRKLKPHHMVVTVEGDEEPRKVAVPNVRNRWERVAAVLDSMRWVKIEARSKDGGTLAILEPPSEDATPLASNRTDDVVQIRERDLLDLLIASNDRAVARALEAQRVGNERAEAMMSTTFDSVRALLEMLTVSTRAVVSQYTQALTISAATSAAPAQSPEGLAALMPLLATMKSMADAGKAPPAPAKVIEATAKPNGAAAVPKK